MKIGDRIKDVEDDDCHYYGTVTKVSEDGEVLEYLLDGIFWDNEEDNECQLIGEIVTPFWYYIEEV